MAKYRVVKAFSDLEDNGHVYWDGDEFPRSGFSVTDARIKELSTDGNKQGIPLIACIKEQEEKLVEEPKKPAKRGRKPRVKRNDK